MKHMSRWVYALVGFVVLLFAGLVYAWSVLSAPIAAEFRAWTAAQLSLTFTLVMIMFCVGQIVCGIMGDEYTAKMKLISSALLFLAGFFITSRATSLIMLYLGFGVMCGLASGLSYHAIIGTVVRWFPDKPGFISGFLLMGFGLGSFVIGKLYQALTPSDIGAWRFSFAVMGIVISAVLFICSFFIAAPQAQASTSAKAAVCRNELDTRAMLRRADFWLYYFWAIMLSAAGLALISQAGSIVSEVKPDIPAATVATIVGLISVFNAIGRIFFGSAYDKFGRSLSMHGVNLLFILCAIVVILAIKSHSAALLIAGFIIGGLAYSGVTPTNAAFIRDYYGTKHYSMNFPMINTNLIFASFGSTLSAALFDATHSYNSSFILILALATLGILCSLGISIQDKKAK